ncbi:MAG TPA: DUF4192 domain-containing protein [Intrasporangium sp.]|uniref:DUF4192 domain-containing protein n=1 Tax=Intrasporangium sp. TaxID=1925024 RepID=UPI002B4A27E2|nr:DUF4192 domain-containing protein [Intrasporangium sp.]HKX66989.1 DUF4192 domain-containing protein [Intrasporangium sp.]
MQRISVSGPAELVTIVPFHLGFQPERSVVVICLRDRAVGLVARIDVVGSPHAAEAAAQLTETIRREGATAVALVSYESRSGEARPLAAALGAALGLAGIPVTEDLVVRDGRWYCLRADDCPDEGKDLPSPADVPAVAGYVALGRAVLADREAMESLVRPAAETGDLGSDVGQAIEQWRRSYHAALRTRSLRWVEHEGVDLCSEEAPSDRPTRWDVLADECFAAWGRLLDGGEPVDLDTLLPAVVGPLDDKEVRDALIAWLCPGWLQPDVFDDRLRRRLEALDTPGGRSGQDVEDPADCDSGPGVDDLPCDERQVEHTLEALCRATPARFAAPVLTIAASHAWWRGDGTKAGMCIDVALEIEPDHKLARLMRLSLDHGLRMPAA